MNNYTVTPEFKERATQILSAKKFSAVFPFMNLINREGFIYTEQELNSLVQYLGEFAYNEVAEFFTVLPTLVQENEVKAQAEETIEQPTETEA